MTTYNAQYGVVTVAVDGVTIRATGSQLHDWTHRPGAAWPCSTLDDLDSLTVTFDRGGLVELDAILEGDDVSDDEFYGPSGDELSAWSSDVLRPILPIDHPAYDVCVGQFADR